MPSVTQPKFEDLTETTGIPLSPEGAEMMFTRYQLAAELGSGKRVLELGCGSGQGFGLLLPTARQVVGGDYSYPLLAGGKAHYGQRVPLVRLSADALPFRPHSFDLVLFFEASYYVPDMSKAFDDIERALAPGGRVLFVNANPQRPDFIRSPHSIHYHSADEFRHELQKRNFDVTVEGAFPVEPASDSLKARVVGLVFTVARKTLETFGLVPKTLRSRARIKRLLYKHLPEVPAELSAGFATTAPRVPVPAGPVTGYKVLYVTGVKR